MNGSVVLLDAKLDGPMTLTVSEIGGRLMVQYNCMKAAVSFPVSTEEGMTIRLTLTRLSISSPSDSSKEEPEAGPAASSDMHHGKLWTGPVDNCLCNVCTTNRQFGVRGSY